MQEALDVAWVDNDPAVRVMQQRLFPAGKPTLEDFITITATLAIEVEVQKIHEKL